MALILEQFSVGTTAAPCFNIPPGAMNVYWYTTDTVNTTFLALSAAGATAATALAVTSNVAPVPLIGWGTSKGAQIYAYASAPTTINVVMQTSQ